MSLDGPPDANIATPGRVGFVRHGVGTGRESATAGVSGLPPRVHRGDPGVLRVTFDADMIAHGRDGNLDVARRALDVRQRTDRSHSLGHLLAQTVGLRCRGRCSAESQQEKRRISRPDKAAPAVTASRPKDINRGAWLARKRRSAAGKRETARVFDTGECAGQHGWLRTEIRDKLLYEIWQLQNTGLVRWFHTTRPHLGMGRDLDVESTRTVARSQISQRPSGRC